MIPFDFEYYRPSSVAEALEIFNKSNDSGKRTIYLSGSTEFITFARMNQQNADVVIDLKGIPDCTMMEINDQQLVIGTAVPLNKIKASNLFPLLGQKIKYIADHTSRNKITLGGNLNSRLIYRESVLPLLLTDTKAKIAGKDGEKILPLKDVFNQKMNIKPGEFLMQIMIEQSDIGEPYVSLKKTKMSKVSYPIVSIAALMKNKRIRAAFSGVCEYPFRSTEIEEQLNDDSFTKEEKIEQTITHLPTEIIEDIFASAGYREFVLKNALSEMIDTLEGVRQ